MLSGRLKQSKPTSAAGFAGGLLFVGLGIFVVIPKFGAFGVVWTAMAAIIACYHGYGLFSRRGVALYELEGDGGQPRSTADRLAELEEAKRKGLITEAEYQMQRSRIISSV
jgi:hypothetical protein